MSILDRLFASPDDDTDPREEAYVACRSLDLDLTSASITHLTVGDFVRLAYTAGRETAEARLSSRDVADGIAQALDLPQSICARLPGETDGRWKVRAVQQVVAYGVPR